MRAVLLSCRTFPQDDLMDVLVDMGILAEDKTSVWRDSLLC